MGELRARTTARVGRQPEADLPQVVRRTVANHPFEQARLPGFGAIGATALLDLQRLAGNAAVAHLVQHAVERSPLVQRYEAGEHAQFGARKGEKEEVFDFDGVKVTYGETIAMADLFESVDKLRAFAKQVYKGKDGKEQNALQHLVDLIRRDKVARQPGGPPPGAPGIVTNNEWEDATAMLPASEHYLEVTARNTAHFAPPSPSMPAPGPSMDHKSMWVSWHMQALDLARQGKREKALETTAFADHFLTDAFAAGHLINKPQIMALTKKKIEAKNGPFTYSEPFTDKIAAGILADAKAKARLDHYEIRTTGWYDMNASSLSKVIFGVYEDKANQENFLSLYANAVHNRLNHMLVTDKVGVKVKNKVGKEWELSGDETLALSPKSLEYGREAVAQSRQNILDTVGRGASAPVDTPDLIEKVWRWTPQPTPDGQKMIDDAIATYANPEDQKTIDAVVEMSIVNLDIMIDKLQEPKINRLRPKKPAPVPAGHY